jgi:hypothetical protein
MFEFEQVSMSKANDKGKWKPMAVNSGIGCT